MRKIPDLRSKGRGIVGCHHPFTEDDARQLAGQFGFSTDYPLRERLNNAADSYYLWNTAERSPSSSTQKDVLKELERRALGLAEALTHLGGLASRISQGVDLSLTERNQVLLAANARAQADRITKDKVGRDKDGNLYHLIKRLHGIYQDGTGRNDKITYDAIKGRYSGRFYTFTCECVRIIGVKHKTPLAIGQVIRKVVGQ